MRSVPGAVFDGDRSAAGRRSRAASEEAGERRGGGTSPDPCPGMPLFLPPTAPHRRGAVRPVPPRLCPSLRQQARHVRPFGPARHRRRGQAAGGKGVRMISSNADSPLNAGGPRRSPADSPVPRFAAGASIQETTGAGRPHRPWSPAATAAPSSSASSAVPSTALTAGTAGCATATTPRAASGTGITMSPTEGVPVSLLAGSPRTCGRSRLLLS